MSLRPPSEQAWAYGFNLPGGYKTKSKFIGPLRVRNKLSIMQSLGLEGSTVLDVGCSEGLFTFYSAEFGAEHSLGVDIDAERIQKAEWVKNQLGIGRASFLHADLLNAEPKSFGRFDVVLGFGLLHRVPDVFNALSTISSHGSTIALEWVGVSNGTNITTSLAHFSGGADFEWKNMIGRRREAGLEDDGGNQLTRAEFWNPSTGAVIKILEMLGFEDFLSFEESNRNRAGRLPLRQMGANKLSAPSRWKRTRLYLIASRKRGDLSGISEGLRAPIRTANWHAPEFDEAANV